MVSLNLNGGFAPHVVKKVSQKYYLFNKASMSREKHGVRRLKYDNLL